MVKKAHEILADALESASGLAVNHVVQARLLKEKQVTLLKKEGFLKPIIRGWYLLDADLSTPDTGSLVLWHESYWSFIGQYLHGSLGEDYVLSAEQSLDIHTGFNHLPTQILIGNSKKVNRVVKLPRELSMSLFTMMEMPKKPDRYEGVNIYPLEAALVKVGPSYFHRQPQEIALALNSAKRNVLLSELLEGGHVAAAGRLAGAFREIIMPEAADEIISAMTAAGFSVVETQPFSAPVPDIAQMRSRSPHAARIALLWQDVSAKITPLIAALPSRPVSIESAVAKLEETYTHDAYHSLSIEGYKVSPELIERVRLGHWNPEENTVDKQQIDAMAARGYWEAHTLVKDMIVKLFNQTSTVEQWRADVADVYRALFGPMVRVGILTAVDLAGYRSRPVFISGSRHTPLPSDALTDAMETLFACAKVEKHPLVRAILSHWLIGYIHPFPDGNGRTARFLMNAILVSSGYPWTIIRLEKREAYMEALEQLSTAQNPKLFVALILEAMDYQWQ